MIWLDGDRADDLERREAAVAIGPAASCAAIRSVTRSRRRFRRARSVLGLLAAAVLAAGGLASAEQLPSVAETLRGTPFSSADAKTVLAGRIAITTVDAPSKRELVVGLACLMPEGAPATNPFAAARPMLPDALADRFELIEPETIHEVLESLTVTEDGADELRRYLAFEPGIGLNLSAEEMEAFEALKTSHGGRLNTEQTRREVVRHLADRMDRYREAGLAGIAPYLREQGKVARPDEELQRALEQAHTMEKRFPDFFRFWNEYPKFALPGATERFFWMRSPIRDRRALILGHQTSWQQGDVHMVGERHFYISHFFNGGYTVAFTIPVQEGRLFAMMERLWIDGYSGMAGLKRSAGRKMIASRLKDDSLQRKACGDR